MFVLSSPGFILGAFTIGSEAKPAAVRAGNARSTMVDRVTSI